MLKKSMRIIFSLRITLPENQITAKETEHKKLAFLFVKVYGAEYWEPSVFLDHKV
jgi:hypothetical protein